MLRSSDQGVELGKVLTLVVEKRPGDQAAPVLDEVEESRDCSLLSLISAAAVVAAKASAVLESRASVVDTHHV